MGKLDELIKLVSRVGERNPKAAEDILKIVDNPEFAVSLSGKERNAYLEALNNKYGSKETRAFSQNFDVRPEAEKYIHSNEMLNTAEGSNVYPADKFEGNYESSGVSPGPLSPIYGPSAKTIDLKNEMHPLIVKERELERIPYNERSEFENKLLKQTQNKIHDLNEQRSAEKLRGYHGTKDQSALKDKLTNQQFDYDKQLAELSNRPVRSLEREKELQDLNRLKKDEIANHEKLVEKEVNSQGQKTYPVATTPENKGDTSQFVFDGKNVRSRFAAFDPRFQDSKLLLAGAGVMPNIDMNPISSLRKGVGYYEKAKDAALAPLANELDLTRDKSATEGLKQGLGLALDPLNLVEGPEGIGLGILQMMGQDPSDNKDAQSMKEINQKRGMRLP